MSDSNASAGESGSKVQDMEVDDSAVAAAEPFQDSENGAALAAVPEDEQTDAATTKASAADDAVSSDGKEATANDTGTEDGSTAKELPYSTRGRSTTNNNSNNSTVDDNKSDTRSAASKELSALEEPPAATSSHKKEPTLGASFLESLTEEERRTRTRIIPDVEGMHALRKGEIKEDLALARSLPTIATSQSNIQTRTARLAGVTGRKKDVTMLDGDDVAMLVQDNRTVTIELPTRDVTVPSDVFVAPEGVVVGEAEGTIAVKEPSKKDAMVQNPSMVEATIAFNPPRPPESVGPKQRHRVIRWERRPEDIEVDMKNYRRTVQRTREELQKSEQEYERLETIDSHLRRHFMSHLELLNEENKRLHNEMQVEVQKLMKESDLVGSRTRSRNLTKVSMVMRDVLNSLSSSAPMSDAGTEHVEVPSIAVPGIGGLNAQTFVDWDLSTDIKAMVPAISWLVPGQKVSTPYGDGVVENVFPPELPPPGSTDGELALSQTGSPEHMKNAEFQKTSNRKRGSVAQTKADEEKAMMMMQEHLRYQHLKPARVQVRMPYGMGVFGLDTITKLESPAKYTDSQLAARWRAMTETALRVSPCVDFPGLTSQMEKNVSDLAELGADGAMDIDEGAKVSAGGTGSTDASAVVDDDRFLPLGSSLFPTKGGRGNYLHEMSIVDIEKGLQEALYDGFGVLGDPKNPGTTKDIRQWEDEEQEYLTLRSSVLQLKNKLNRQRRIRLLNERTSASMTDRHQKAEELVFEMRSDLKSLKRRLAEELTELGITDEVVSQILTKYYKGQDEDDKGDASTPKRLRRAGSVGREKLSGVEMSNLDGSGRDSNDEQGMDDMSGDDMESTRAAKKARA
ncbi:hypothetical protein IV203_005536 [Nitzschia inconspicua]|uniref:Uncharacterized protein n=1 Tax=Nitzschia inconspicua TaxID=303405 RepID=A0A9K3PGF5_9STRA|nr:hypothetical protein IV203_005536 [Nitzschia inconspicua]